MAITAFLSRSPGLLNRGPGGLGAQPLWDMVLIPAFSLQLQLLNQGPLGPPLLGAGTLYSYLSPTDLNFLSPGLYNNLTPTLLPAGVTISHPIRQSRLYPDIPRPDAPVIYTGAFLILTAWPGWMSIYNKTRVESYQRLKKWYLMSPCITLSIIRYRSRVKWSNPGNRVAPSLIPQRSSY